MLKWRHGLNVEKPKYLIQDVQDSFNTKQVTKQRREASREKGGWKPGGNLIRFNDRGSPPPSSRQGACGVQTAALQRSGQFPALTPLSVPTWCCRARRGARPRIGPAWRPRTRAVAVFDLQRSPSSRFPSERKCP